MSASPLSRHEHAASGNSSREGNTTVRRLVAVTRDAALALVVQELAAEIPVVVLQDLGRLPEELLQHGGSLALLDAAAVTAPLNEVVDALAAQFPDVRLMVAGQAAEQGLLAARIAEQTVFRFVHKPASAQRLRLFIDADARATSRRREPVAAAEGAAPRPPSRLTFVLAGLAAAAVAVMAAWFFWPHGAAARLNARDLARVETLLQQADQAMAAGRFVAFDGSSAAEQYRSVLQLDPENETGRAGLQRALGNALARARRALAGGRLDEATNTMEAIRVIAPGQAGLNDLVTQVEAETRRQLADAKAGQAMMERQAQIRAAVDKVEAGIRSGALLDPAADSAATAFQSAQALSPGDAAVRTARGELTAALVAAGENALAAHRLAEARRYAAATGRINSTAAGFAALLQHIEDAAAVRTTPPATAASGASAPATTPAPVPPATTPSPAPAPAPADIIASVTPPPPPATVVEPPTAPAAAPAATPSPAAWIPGEGVVSSRQLKLLRQVPVDYPQDALSALISGWVDLEFTVARDGSVKDVKVTASQPSRTFDNAAVAAQRRFRYAPVLKDGQPVEQRARARINFTAQDQR